MCFFFFFFEQDVRIKNLSDELSLVALQGPDSAAVLSKVFEGVFCLV